MDGLNPDNLKEYPPILEARYKSIVSLILKSGIPQVLELASGFSLRGLAMTRDAGMTYIETDLDELTSEKIRLVSEIRAQYQLEDYGNQHIAAANALDPVELRAAVRPLRRDRQLVIVNEGLIQYFSVAERETLASNVHDLLREFGGGVWITPDFATKTDAKNISEERKRLRQVITGVTERSFYDAAFDTDEKVSAFFTDFGFRSALYDQVDETQYFASVKTLGLSPDLLERAKHGLKVWVLSAV
jgi:O-methyltransferase involved in polyketide biosynthesis